jgi:hypothetical protein
MAELTQLWTQCQLFHQARDPLGFTLNSSLWQIQLVESLQLYSDIDHLLNLMESWHLDSGQGFVSKKKVEQIDKAITQL